MSGTAFIVFTHDFLKEKDSMVPNPKESILRIIASLKFEGKN